MNIGTAFCPYRVFRRAPLIEDLTRLGYRLVDEWATPESCPIPFFADYSVANCTGLYLTRDAPDAPTPL